MYSIRLVIQSIALSKISIVLEDHRSVVLYFLSLHYKYFTFPELFLFVTYFLFIDSIDSIDSQDY